MDKPKYKIGDKVYVVKGWPQYGKRSFRNMGIDITTQVTIIDTYSDIREDVYGIPNTFGYKVDKCSRHYYDEESLSLYPPSYNIKEIGRI